MPISQGGTSSVTNVSANILVTGNVYMDGNLAFNSTMYVLGDTIINNVNISGLNKRELILMTQGKLELARVNKFIIPDSITAYIYTASNAEAYAVGSNIQIVGGFFAKGNLEINAFRGETNPPSSNDLQFTPRTDVESSRFILTNTKDQFTLFTDRQQGLPKVKKLEVITDLMEKE